MATEQVNTVAALPYNRFCYPAAMYAGSVGCMDTIAEATGSYPMPMGGGFGPSVFGGGCMPFMGMSGMMGGMGCYGYGPGSEYMRMDTKQAVEYQNELRKQQLTGGVELARQTQDANFQVTTYNDMIVKKIAVLKNLIKENNQDQIPAAYEELKDAVRVKLKHVSGDASLTERQVDSEAEKEYYAASGDAKRTIVDDLDKYGDSPFMSGFKKALGGVGWVFMENKTATQNIAEIEGVKVPKSEKAKETAGKVVSVILSVVGAIALWKFGKAVLKPGTLKIVTEAAKTLTPAEKLANIEAHIKGLEGDSRMADLIKNNYCENISELHQGYLDGISFNATKNEKELLDAYVQARAKASKLKADMFTAKHNEIMSS